jgi:glycosyltransferase involved in cell wall biosynthesis
MKVIAVIPAWHEQGRVGKSVQAIQPHVDAVFVVDDGSRDETAQEAVAAGAVVLRHSLNRGQGAALKTGTLAALRDGADIVVHFDADGQHDPQDVSSMIDLIKRGDADVVFGSRFLGIEAEGIPRARRLLLLAARLFNAYALGIPYRVTDPQNGLRVLSRQAAEQIDFRQDMFAHASEILRLVTRSKLRWKEVPMKVRYTSETLAKGQKWSNAFKIVWQLFIGSFRS